MTKNLTTYFGSIKRIIILLSIISFAFSYSALAQLTCPQSDNFDPAYSNTLWQQISGGLTATNCGSVSGNRSLYFTTGLTSRFALTAPFNIETGVIIDFWMIIGWDPNGPPCDKADSAQGDHVILEYTKNGGTSWKTIRIYYAESIFNTWQHVTETVMLEGCNPSTQFRWRQLSINNQGNRDVWAIDDVNISCTQSVTYHPKPVSSFWTTDTIVCDTSSVSKFANHSLGMVDLAIGFTDTAIWDFGDGTIDTIVYDNIYYPIITDTVMGYDTTYTYITDTLDGDSVLTTFVDSTLIDSFTVYETVDTCCVVNQILRVGIDPVITQKIKTVPVLQAGCCYNTNPVLKVLNTYQDTTYDTSYTQIDSCVLTNHTPDTISHTYQNTGTYTVSLKSINVSSADSVKSDILTRNNYLLVVNPPIPPLCQPQTNVTCCGEGISYFNFNGLTAISGTAEQEGYTDFCQGTRVYAGNEYTMIVKTTPAASEMNVEAWIDYNNDAVFSQNEMVFATEKTKGDHSQYVTIDKNAVMGTPLRLRVGHYPFGYYAQLDPCAATINYGQFEDYFVIVDSNINKPKANFMTDEPITCDGEIQFTDLSTNIPTSWSWDFGDGNTSTLQNPIHTYTKDSVYTVKLTVTNAFGWRVMEREDYITVRLNSTPTPPNCTPETVFEDCAGYGIYNVGIYYDTATAGIDTLMEYSSDCGTEGYQDFACFAQAEVIEGIPYELRITGNPDFPQDAIMWIDLNDDGEFGNGENMFVMIDAMHPAGLFKVPALQAPHNKLLRMRIASDYSGSNLGPCLSPTYGQVEDYGITITENTLPPVAQIVDDKDTICIGDAVYFKENSLNGVTSWEWDFGDGKKSFKRNPAHYYGAAGTYNIKLKVCGPYGCDSTQVNSLVMVIPVCTFYQSEGGSDQCEGILYDVGGLGDYTDESSATFVIAPKNATKITLTFSAFSFDPTDSIWLYDGTSASAPLIGSPLTGTSLPGIKVANSGAMTVRFRSHYSPGPTPSTSSGFVSSWVCEGGPAADFTLDPATTDTCNELFGFVNLSQNSTSWEWDFGDGGSDTIRNPDHTYSNFGIDYYTVSLVANSAFGTDTLVKQFNNYHIKYVGFFKDVDTIYLFPPNNGRVQFYDSSQFYITDWLWDFGDDQTSTLEDPVHFYDSIGFFTVTLIASNMCETDTLQKDVFVKQKAPEGVWEKTADPFIRIFPNPSNGDFTLFYHSYDNNPISILITDLLGVEVYSEKVNHSYKLEKTLSLNSLKKGVYFIRIKNNYQQTIKKIIIQ